MAKDTARNTHLWQVPIFLLGCMAAAGMYFFEGEVAKHSPHSPDHLLTEARAALAATPVDLEGAIARAEQIIERTELPSRLLGEAHYLLGWAYQEKNTTDDTAKARHHFEEADKNGVPEADRNRLIFRLSKVWLSTNADPHLVVGALNKIADASDNPYDAYGVLIEAYQRLNDQAGIIEATKQQLAHAPPGMDPAKLANTRLRLGELMIAAGNAKEARVVLSRVGPDAPSEIAFAASMLLARCFEVSNDWPGAVRAWDAVSNDARLNPSDKAHARYGLGLALAHTQQPVALLKLEEAQAVDPNGDWGRAAAIRIAELCAISDTKRAMQKLQEAVPPGATFQSQVLSSDDLKAIFEQACEQLKTANDFASAIEFANVYSRVATGGRAMELRGQLCAAWADAFVQAGQIDQASVQQVEAAKAFLAAGSEAARGPVIVYRLWSAAQAASAGRDYAMALDALNRLVPLHGYADPARVAEAWYATGQVQENLKDLVAARSAYQKCLTMDPPWRFRARYQLAQIELTDARRDAAISNDPKVEEAVRIQYELAARVKFDDAEKMLQENLSELRQAVQPDPAVQELTVYGMADIAYERQEYATAEPRLRGALQEYPQSTLAVRGHYRLALCVWNRATAVFAELSKLPPNDPQRESTQKKYLDNIAAAGEQFAAVEAALLPKQMSLNPVEAEMLRRSSFGKTEMIYFAGRYAEAAGLYEELARRYEGKVEGLKALKELWNCQYTCLNQKDKALDTMERLRTALDKIPDSEFHGQSEQFVREYWVKKLVEMARQN
ncbi:MAG: hypothetical protein ACJ8C4_10785 [Gemmataceae bacterium]